MTETFASALVSNIASIPYDKALIRAINSNRHTLGGKLFFDALCEHLIDTELEYPPKDKASLLLIIQLIESCETTSTLNQASLLYYIFLDYPLSLTNNEDLASYYANEVKIPVGHANTIKGFWHLDHLEFDLSLNFLGHPSAKSTYPEKVIESYVKNAPEPSSMVMAYVACKLPEFSGPSLEYYITMLCSVSLYSCLQFSRQMSRNSRECVFQDMVDYALSSKNMKRDVWRLANLPLDDTESNYLESYLLRKIENHDQNMSLLKDILLVRALHTGQFETAKRIGNSGNSTNTQGQLSWTDISQGIQFSGL